jgi:hypothetical protein
MSARISFPTDLAGNSLRPRASVGFLAFPAFSLGRLGKPGGGVLARDCRLGTQHSVYGLVNLKLKLETETRWVTWAYFADSTRAHKKLDANNPPITYNFG